MTWWGKLAGGVLGFMLGGPLGALLGVALGHGLDHAMGGLPIGFEKPDPAKRARVQRAFFTATFSIMGHMAKEGKRWRVIHEYIERNESLCILLSATPYNKTYRDLSAQLGLFLREDQDLGIRPEKLISALGGEHEFIRRHQCPVRSIAAFEKSGDPDDWRDLMRLYMVRRTRGFIARHYAREDEHGKYLRFADGRKSYFPRRTPKTLSFAIDDADPADPYARFYAGKVVGAINSLTLPRYGLGNYLMPKPEPPPTPHQSRIIADLSRAGIRLKGFCRINLFKRLESAGPAFLLSLERHILRNFIVLRAIENGLAIPLGAQGAELLDTRYHDEDQENTMAAEAVEEDDDEAVTSDPGVGAGISTGLRAEADYRARAEEVYADYSRSFRNRFKWLPSGLFDPSLAEDLLADARALIRVLADCGDWQPEQDAKLEALVRLIQTRHPEDKLLVFTQFADTARYLAEQLDARGIRQVGLATGDSPDPTQLAWRFSPESNDKKVTEALRVLIATDVLSEGQNLQDCAIIVNYDLPWAIIRLIQRAGRVDRIGQKSEEILCYSFLPADGIERLIRLRARVRQRLEENAEVVGSDETFFDDDEGEKVILDLYNEKSGILDDEGDTEVDLASYAYQIWKDATDADPSLAGKIEALPNVVYATKEREAGSTAAKGVLVYMRTARDNDALAWMDESGQPVTQSQLVILKAATCSADTPARPRTEQHHDLTRRGLAHILEEEKSFGGALGRPSGARFKTYERLKRYREGLGDHRDLFITDEQVDRIDRALQEILRYPLYQAARDTLNRQLKADIADHKLAELVLGLREDGRLCLIDEAATQRAPQLICSLGLV